MADNLFFKHTGIRLKRYEKELLKLIWNDYRYLCYKELVFHYSENYLDEILINLMEKLSEALNEPVNKDNFIEVFKRRWEKDNRTNLSRD